MSMFQADLGHLQSLKDLLRLRPPEEEGARELVLTTVPEYWTHDGQLGTETVVVDLRRLVGAAGTWKQSGVWFESQLEEDVYETLRSVGWPEESVRRQYRPHGKSPFALDIALLDTRGAVVAAIEVKSLLFASRGESQAKRILREFPSIRRVYVADGRTYTCFGAEGSTEPSEEPPGPEDFGIARASTSATTAPIRPSESLAVRAVAAEHRPESIIVDFSFPWGSPVSQNAPVRDLLPDLEGSSAIKAEIHQILLAWVASLESVRWASSIVLPQSTFSVKARWLREHLTTALGLKAHIELPPGILPAATGVRGSYLLMGSFDGPSYFDSLESPGDFVGISDNRWFTGYRSWLGGGQAAPGFEIDGPSPDTWSVTALDPEAAQIRERLGTFGHLVPLGELSEVFVGVRVRKGELLTDPEGEAVLVVDGRRLRSSPDETIEDMYLPESAPVKERDRLNEGDILISRVVSPGFKAYMFGGGESAVAGTALVVIRLRDDRCDPRYLVEFLNSTAGQRLLRSASTGSVVPQLAISAIRNVPVPILADFDLRAVEDVEDIRARLESKGEELTSKRRALFDSADSHELQSRLSVLQMRSDIINRAVNLADSRDFRIGQFYPFPLAYGYRLLGSYVDPRERYQEQLRVAENILAFLGSVSLAIMDDDQRATLTLELEKYWQGGISPGDWVQMCAKSTKRLRDLRGSDLAVLLAALNPGSDKKGIGKEFAYLVRAKNDFKHDRGPKVEQEVVAHSAEMQGSLDRCMEMLGFWMKYPIRQIQNMDKPRGRVGVVLDCLQLVGDHPACRREKVDWDVPVTIGDLQVEVGDRYWQSLYPWVQRLVCSQCGIQETYFVDRWDRRKQVVGMKSFERGHTVINGETAAAIEAALDASAQNS